MDGPRAKKVKIEDRGSISSDEAGTMKNNRIDAQPPIFDPIDDRRYNVGERMNLPSLPRTKGGAPPSKTCDEGDCIPDDLAMPDELYTTFADGGSGDTYTPFQNKWYKAVCLEARKSAGGIYRFWFYPLPEDRKYSLPKNVRCVGCAHNSSFIATYIHRKSLNEMVKPWNFKQV